MAELRAGSTAHVMFTPVTPLSELTLAAFDDKTDAAIDLGQPANASGDGLSWAFDPQSTAVPMAKVGSILRLEWKQTAREGQVRTSVEYVSVLGPEADSDLCSVADVRAYAAIPDGQDDVSMARIISSVSETIRNLRGMPRFTVPKSTDTRYAYLDEQATIMLPELVSVDAVVDEDGQPVEYRAIPGNDGFIRWIELTGVRLDRIPSMTNDHTRSGAIAVTGTFGYNALPAGVVQAAVVSVATIFMRDVADFGGGGTPYGRLGLLPQTALDYLRDIPGRVKVR